MDREKWEIYGWKRNNGSVRRKDLLMDVLGRWKKNENNNDGRNSMRSIFKKNLKNDEENDRKKNVWNNERKVIRKFKWNKWRYNCDIGNSSWRSIDIWNELNICNGSNVDWER